MRVLILTVGALTSLLFVVAWISGYMNRSRQVDEPPLPVARLIE